MRIFMYLKMFTEIVDRKTRDVAEYYSKRTLALLLIDGMGILLLLATIACLLVVFRCFQVPLGLYVGCVIATLLCPFTLTYGYYLAKNSTWRLSGM